MMHSAPRAFHAAPHNFAPRHVAVPHHAPAINHAVTSHPTFRQNRVITSHPTMQRNHVTTGNPTLHNNQIQHGLAGTHGQTNVVHGQVHHGLRPNGQPYMQPDVARRGRFSGAFANNAGHWQHVGHYAPHNAWRRGLRAGFVPWYGPVFWPYAYSDIFDYTFWPGGYDDGYWFYAYDDFFDGVFWGDYGPPADYAYATPSEAPPRAQPNYAAVQELCKQPGAGVTSWPIAEINSKVGLSADQKKLLDDLQASARKAADVFKVSCPANNAFPLTPPGRLQAMTARLQATLEAVQAVHPALTAFYESLSDEQKARFNEIGPGKQVTSAEAKQALPDEAKACSDAKPGLTNLPIDEIQDAVKPSKDQQAELDKLGDAAVKAVGVLQAACPQETPVTPPGRLDAMEKRLQAMIEAANTVKPSLDSFYASLCSEQKERFNRMGRDLAKTGG
jgi:hypothetical protein